MAGTGNTTFIFCAAKRSFSERIFNWSGHIWKKPLRAVYPATGARSKTFRGIDPNPFIDKDGQAYLYWSSRKIFAAKLKENMLELASEPQEVEGLPDKGLKKGFLFERNGIYYLTIRMCRIKQNASKYAMGSGPMGPFKVAGVIMDESPALLDQPAIGHSLKGSGIYFITITIYRQHLNKKVRKDRQHVFNADGTIKKVVPTLRGGWV